MVQVLFTELKVWIFYVHVVKKITGGLINFLLLLIVWENFYEGYVMFLYVYFDLFNIGNCFKWIFQLVKNTELSKILGVSKPSCFDHFS